MQNTTAPKPANSLETPRFAGISTFFRLPTVADPDGLDLAVFGVPFDGGQSYRVGSRFAPAEIRKMSATIKPFNPALQVSPYDHLKVADLGDCPVNPLDPAKSRELIQSFVERVVAAGATPVAVGGDHSITLPILRALAKKHGPVALVQVDSHLDTGEAYFGTRFGGGTPFRRAVEEKLIDPKKWLQIGIRGSVYASDDFDFIRDHGATCITGEMIYEKGFPWVIEQIKTLRDSPCYCTYDIDGIDPAYAPGTTAPVPGGPNSSDAIAIVRAFSGFKQMVGFDIVEVQPAYDVGSVTSMLAASLTWEFISVQAAARARQ
ncbi:agmatinase [Pseudochelatococcus sp. B33]